MLRKILLLGLPLFVVVAAVTTVAFYEKQRAPSWQQTLEQYFEHHAPADSDAVVARVAAQLPWAFTAEMGRAVVDAEAWQWSIEQLPYPPDALFCVLVDESAFAALRPSKGQRADGVTTQRLVYVAHHTDKLWRVGWVVHEGGVAPFSVETMADLVAVGCDLGMVAVSAR